MERLWSSEEVEGGASPQAAPGEEEARLISRRSLLKAGWVAPVILAAPITGWANNVSGSRQADLTVPLTPTGTEDDPAAPVRMEPPVPSGASLRHAPRGLLSTWLRYVRLQWQGVWGQLIKPL